MIKQKSIYLIKLIAVILWYSIRIYSNFSDSLKIYFSILLLMNLEGSQKNNLPSNIDRIQSKQKYCSNPPKPEPLKITTLFKQELELHRSEYLSQADLIKDYGSIAKSLNKKKRKKSPAALEDSQQSLDVSLKRMGKKQAQKQYGSDSIAHRKNQEMVRPNGFSEQIPKYQKQILEDSSQSCEQNQNEQQRKESSFKIISQNQVLSQQKGSNRGKYPFDSQLKYGDDKLYINQTERNNCNKASKKASQMDESFRKEIMAVKNLWEEITAQREKQEKQWRRALKQKMEEIDKSQKLFQQQNNKNIAQLNSKNQQVIKKLVVQPFKVQRASSQKELKAFIKQKIQNSVLSCVHLENKKFWSCEEQKLIGKDEKTKQNVKELRNRIKKRVSHYEKSLDILTRKMEGMMADIQDEISEKEERQTEVMNRIEKKIIALEFELSEQLRNQKKNEEEMFEKIKNLAIKINQRLFNEDEG